ncbi:MAG: ATP-binding cassette domain-containing protein [Candidatus Bathyarchaeia archaeon]
MVIKVESISYTYKFAKRKALKNFSLEVKEGEFVGIIGPTGAGKTTLCYCLSGIIPHIIGGELEGRVIIKGIDTKEISVAKLSQTVGFCQQDAETQLFMTDVEKEIAFPLENLALPTDEIKSRLESILKITRLARYRKRHPFFLSGGEKQRVVLASVLAMRPEILILDETTSELDPLGVEEVMELIGLLKEEKKTVIMVEHDLDRLAKFADRIVLINGGEKIAEGPTREILSDVKLLESCGIDPPWVTRIALNLINSGLSLERIPITLEEGVEEIEKILKESKKE